VSTYSQTPSIHLGRDGSIKIVVSGGHVWLSVRDSENHVIATIHTEAGHDAECLQKISAAITQHYAPAESPNLQVVRSLIGTDDGVEDPTVQAALNADA
jgi:hypothetical protein